MSEKCDPIVVEWADINRGSLASKALINCEPIRFNAGARGLGVAWNHGFRALAASGCTPTTATAIQRNGALNCLRKPTPSVPVSVACLYTAWRYREQGFSAIHPQTGGPLHAVCRR